MYDFGSGFAIGMAATFALCVMLFSAANVADQNSRKPTLQYLADLKEKIAQCESTLPRNETCVLVAVPERKKEA